MRRLILIPVLGLALITAGFVLLVPERPWTPLLWLDLGVFYTIFIVNLSFFGFIARGGDFEEQIGTLGFGWVTRGLYTIAALWTVWAGFRYQLSFNVSLLIQLALAFGLVVRAVLTYTIRDNQARVTSREAPMRDRIDEIRSVAGNLLGPVAQLGPAFESVKTRYRSVHDDLQYMSAMDSPEAVQLDNDLLASLQALGGSVREGGRGPQGLAAADFDRQFAEIQEIIRRRKNCRH